MRPFTEAEMSDLCVAEQEAQAAIRRLHYALRLESPHDASRALHLLADALGLAAGACEAALGEPVIGGSIATGRGFRLGLLPREIRSRSMSEDDMTAPPPPEADYEAPAKARQRWPGCICGHALGAHDPVSQVCGHAARGTLCDCLHYVPKTRARREPAAAPKAENSRDQGGHNDAAERTQGAPQGARVEVGAEVRNENQGRPDAPAEVAGWQTPRVHLFPPAA